MSDVNISIDTSKLERLSEKVMGDAAGAMGVMMAYIGDQTGIYKKMESLGPATTANISEAVLQIIANADAKFVTESDTVGYKGVSYFGFVVGEDRSNLGGSLSIARSDASNHVAGSYTLTPSGLTSSNYDILFSTGVYTIVPANQLLIELSKPDDVVPAEVCSVIQRYTTPPYFTKSLTLYLVLIAHADL